MSIFWVISAVYEIKRCFAGTWPLLRFTSITVRDLMTLNYSASRSRSGGACQQHEGPYRGQSNVTALPQRSSCLLIARWQLKWKVKWSVSGGWRPAAEPPPLLADKDQGPCLQNACSVTLWCLHFFLVTTTSCKMMDIRFGFCDTVEA